MRSPTVARPRVPASRPRSLPRPRLRPALDRLPPPFKLWIMKAVVQKAISVMPAGHRVNGVLQRHVTRRQRLTAKSLDTKLGRTRDHLEGYAEFAGGTPRAVLELGTGWFPVVPVAMSLSGVERVHSVDITSHVTPENLAAAAGRVLEAAEENPERFGPWPDEERMGSLREILDASDGPPPVDDVAEVLGIDFIVGDAATVDLPDESIDLIVSNNTLEHIPEPVIRRLLVRFRGLVAPDGVMSHFIDLSDHFAHLDRSITIYNFLRFSERQWRWIDNDIQPQNRMRCRDHQRMQEELGFQIVRTDPWSGDLDALRRTELHPDYRAMPEREVAISHCHLYAVPA